ncbi:MAG TPA: RluA family pseudouridine synthase [Actinomycetota bacterium]|nr:RluA family pseudouridine synthase [Actinomycetota bacterium]
MEVEGRPGRLDAVVAEALGVPRADVQRAIARGHVLVDGRTRPKSFRLRGGERIEARLEAAAPLEPAPGGIAVRHEDEHLLVVAKPAGLLTHPTSARRTGTVVNRLLAMGVPLSTAGGDDRPGIVHRLDVGTSGLLIVAKDDDVHRALAGMLAAREVERRYLALVRGAPPHDAFTVEAPLGRRGARISVRRPAGVEAATSFETRERLPAATLLEARPRTGRTHQIRVHLSSVDHPILGDAAYGGGGDDARRLGLRRPFLHAWRLRFRHPVSGAVLDLEEPLPEELDQALQRARIAPEARKDRKSGMEAGEPGDKGR